MCAVVRWGLLHCLYGASRFILGISPHWTMSCCCAVLCLFPSPLYYACGTPLSSVLSAAVVLCVCSPLYYALLVCSTVRLFHSPDLDGVGFADSVDLGRSETSIAPSEWNLLFGQFHLNKATQPVHTLKPTRTPTEAQHAILSLSLSLSPSLSCHVSCWSWHRELFSFTLILPFFASAHFEG
jgi:hypothetical protein